MALTLKKKIALGIAGVAAVASLFIGIELFSRDANRYRVQEDIITLSKAYYASQNLQSGLTPPERIETDDAELLTVSSLEQMKRTLESTIEKIKQYQETSRSNPTFSGSEQVSEQEFADAKNLLVAIRAMATKVKDDAAFVNSTNDKVGRLIGAVGYDPFPFIVRYVTDLNNALGQVKTPQLKQQIEPIIPRVERVKVGIFNTPNPNMYDYPMHDYSAEIAELEVIAQELVQISPQILDLYDVQLQRRDSIKREMNIHAGISMGALVLSGLFLALYSRPSRTRGAKGVNT